MKNKISASNGLYIFAFLPPFIYLGCIYFLGVNAPMVDDYPQQFNTIEWYLSGQSISEVLLRLHNEHRLFTTYIVTYIDYLIDGSINLKNGLYWSWIQLVLIYFLIVNELGSNKGIKPLLYLTIGCLIFLFHYFSSVWVGGSVQYFGVILYGLLSIRILTSDFKWRLPFSVILAFLSVYSMASGVAIVGAGIILFLAERRIKKAESIVWIIACVLILMLYFNGYVSPEYHPSSLSFLKNPIFYAQYLCVLISSPLKELLQPIYIQLVFGGLIGIGVLYVGLRNYKTIFLNTRLLSYICFIGAVLFLISIGRSGFNIVGQANGSRYIINVAVFWSLLLVWYYNNDLLSREVLVLICGFIMAFYLNYNSTSILNTAKYTKKLKQGVALYYATNQDDWLEYPVKAHAASMLKKSFRSDYYVAPKVGFSGFQITTPETARNSNDIEYSIGHNSELDDRIYIYGWAYRKNYSMTEHRYVKLGLIDEKEPRKLFLYDTNRLKRDDINQQVSEDVSGCGFLTVLDKSVISDLEGLSIYLVILDSNELIKIQIDLNDFQ